MSDQTNNPLGFETTSQEPTSEEIKQESGYLTNFVGEGKPYASVEDAAEALAKKAVNADAFIEQLKKEKQEQERLVLELSTKAKTAEELLTELKKGYDPSPVVDPVVEDAQPNLDPNYLETWYKEKREEEKRAEIAQQNVQVTKQKLAEAFGGSEVAASEAIKNYINGDEYKSKLIAELSANSPDEVLKLVGKGNMGSPTGSSSVNITNQHAALGLTWSEAKRMKKDNPEFYKSHTFQGRLRQAADMADKLGIDFFTT